MRSGWTLAAVGALLVPASVGRATRHPVEVPVPETASSSPPPGYWDAVRVQMIEASRFPRVRSRGEVYRFPLRDGGRIGSGYGYRWHPVYKGHRFHRGWDLPRARGTPVYASGTGRVEFSGWRAGYGHAVILRHADGRSTLYGHLSDRYVEEGQWAAGGETLLGRVGSTGLSTGPHLHFEVRDRHGRPVDPGGLVRRFTRTE